MGYSVKWVVENLGITRDMLRYYEKEKRLPTNESRNPANKYRDYSDEDIEISKKNVAHRFTKHCR